MKTMRYNDGRLDFLRPALQLFGALMQCQVLYVVFNRRSADIVISPLLL